LAGGQIVQLPQFAPLQFVFEVGFVGAAIIGVVNMGEKPPRTTPLLSKVIEPKKRSFESAVCSFE
jgi:hypothetical protein